MERRRWRGRRRRNPRYILQPLPFVCIWGWVGEVGKEMWEGVDGGVLG